MTQSNESIKEITIEIENKSFLLDTIKKKRSEFPDAKIIIPYRIDNHTISDQKGNPSYDFRNCLFKEEFNVSVFRRAKVSFEECEFDRDFAINGGPGSKEGLDFNKSYLISFDQCKFHQKLTFSANIGSSIDTQNSKIQNLVLSGAKFHNNVRFQWCTISKCSFQNTTFSELIDFYHTQFLKATQFLQTDFHRKAIFSHVTFHHEVQFLYNYVKPDSYISFENAFFTKAIDISRANFYCETNFWRAHGLHDNIEKSTDFFKLLKSSHLYRHDELDLTEFKKDPNPVDIYLRESIRTIKNNFKRKNDNIEALNYQKLEMWIYTQQILWSNKDKKEQFILVMNYISNEHGVNWMRGIIFTLGVAFAFYCFLILTSDKIDNQQLFVQLESNLDQIMNYDFTNLSIFKLNDLLKNDLLQGYFDYLLLTNFKISNFPINNFNPFVFVLFYTGKFLIAYGYYQTIAAFRKFLKN